MAKIVTRTLLILGLLVALGSTGAFAQLDESTRRDLQHVLKQQREQFDAGRHHLTVPDASLSDWFLDYHTRVRETLLADSTSAPYLRMIVLPSFSPEWMVEIDTPTGSAAVVRYVVAEKQVWAEGRSLRSKTRSAPLTLESAEALKAIWLRMLDDVRYPESWALGEDGTTYHVAAFDKGRGLLAGEVWSPPEAAPTGQLVRLGELLRDLAMSREKARGAKQAALTEAIERFANGTGDARP